MTNTIQIDSSQLKEVVNCLRRYGNIYDLCIQKTDMEGTDMDIMFGRGIHTGLEEFYKTGCTPESMKSAIRRFTEVYSDYPGEVAKTVNNGVELLKLYENYHNHNFRNWEVLQCEQTDSFQLLPNLKYIVKIDLVIKLNGNIYVVDFKTTTTKNRPQFLSKFTLDRQSTGYIEWCKRKYGQCSGFIAVGLFMGFRKRATTRNKVHYPAGFWFEPDYTVINKTQEQLDDFIKDTEYWVNRLREAKATGHYPRNTDYCQSYKGCQYKVLCESLDDENVRETLYSIIDPYAYLGEGYGKSIQGN